MTRLYEELDLRVGVEADAPSVASIVKAARATARRGDHAGAFRRLLEVATNAEDVGLTVIAHELVIELREVVDLRRVPAADRLWLLNLQGRLASAVERLDLAKKRFETMLERALRLEDLAAASTALQNLGVNALVTGDAESAIRYANEAYLLKTEIGDEYGAAQVRLNTATALLSAGREAKATKALEEAESEVRSLGQPGLLTTWYGCRAQLSVERGDFERALNDFRQALTYARRSGDLEKVATSMQNLGATYNDLGRPARALLWYEKALDAAGGIGSPARTEVLIRSRAVTLHRLGRDANARADFLLAKALAERLGIEERALTSGVDAAAVLIRMNEATTAREELEALLPKVRKQRADPVLLVNTLANAAAAQSSVGAHSAALEHLREAIEVTEIFDLPEQRMALGRQAGEAALNSEDSAETAPEYFEIQLAVARKLLSRAQRAWEAAEAGALLSSSGLHKESLAFFGRALATYARQRNLRLAFHVRNDRALALIEIGRFADARRDLMACLRVAEQLGDRILQQQAQSNLGEFERRAGRYVEAIARGRAAVELAQAIEDPEAEASATANLGLALLDSGNEGAAEGVYTRLDELGRRMRKSALRSGALRGLARIAEMRSNPVAAAAQYRQAARIDANRPEDLRLDLLSLLSVIAGEGTQAALERTLQRVIDLAQHHHWEADVALDLIHPASLLLERDREAAAGVAAAAILLAGAAEEDRETADPEHSSWFKGVATVLVALALVFEAEASDADQLWRLVERALDSHEKGTAEAIRPMLVEARRIAAEQTKR